MARAVVGHLLFSIVQIEPTGVVEGVGEGGGQVLEQRMVFKEDVEAAACSVAVRLVGISLQQWQMVVFFQIGLYAQQGGLRFPLHR